MDLDIWSYIIEVSDFEMKLKILRLSQHHYDYGFAIEKIPQNLYYKLTNSILKQKKYHRLHTLDASWNNRITYKGQRDLLKNLVF